MSNSQFLKLRNGAVINMDHLQMVLRRGLNDYAIILQHCPTAAAAESSDVDALEEYLSSKGALTVVKPEEMPPSKLAIPD